MMMMMMEEEEEEEEPDDDATPSPHTLHSISHLLALDVCNASHVAVAAGAVAALGTSPKGRARLGRPRAYDIA